MLLDIATTIGTIVGVVVGVLTLVFLALAFGETQAFGVLLGKRGGVRFALLKHLGVDWPKVRTLDVVLSPMYADDVWLTLQRLQDELGVGGAAPIDVSVPSTGFLDESARLEGLALQVFRPRQPPVSRQVELEPGRTQVVKDALYRWRIDGVPVVALGFRSNDKCMFQVGYALGQGEAVAAKLAERFRDEVKRNNRFRGRLVTINHDGSVQVLSRGDAEAPILDEQVRAWLDDAMLAFMRNRAALKQAQIPTKRGVLLVGPPGAGKTSVARWLISEVREFTAILVQGDNPYVLREIFRMARDLAPSLVLLEDVDLIAGERHNNSFALFLGALLTEMDGVQDNEDVMVLMTTNEPREIEKALVRRPGRVDRVIEIGAPKLALRVRLFEHFLSRAKLAAADVDVAAAAAGTDGLMPAALFELVKLAAVKAIGEQRLDGEGKPRITTADILEAVPRLRQQLKGDRGAVGFTSSSSESSSASA